MIPLRLLAIITKELRQLRRDRLTFGMIVGIPIGQLLLFGYAINTDVRNLTTAVADQANTHLSRQFIAEIEQTQVLDIKYSVERPDQMEALLRSGKISVGIHIPNDFDRRVIDPNRTAAHLLVDGADPTILGIANQLAIMPISFDTVSKPLLRRSLEVRPYYNPERKTAINIVP